jgi:predicted RNA-binding Zn ribbon-like protein
MTAFLFVTGQLSLDFCNTSAGGRERLARPADLSDWIFEARLAPRRPRVRRAELAAAVGLRAALRRALLDRDRVAVARVVARWLDDMPGRLEVDTETLGWRFIPAGGGPRCLLVPVVLDALCLAREVPDRVRECAGDRCDVLYLDTSRNRSRRWCSMERCGARAKASAYYQRRRGE